MASPQPDSAFVTRLPLEIRNIIYELYAFRVLDKAAHDNATYKRTGYEYMSNYTQGRTLTKSTRLCPPMVKTCKTIARELAAIVSNYALIMYETPSRSAALRPAALRHVRITWKLAIQYIDDTPEPDVMKECTLQIALGSPLSNLKTIQCELYDIERRRGCDDAVVMAALELTLDHFLANAIKDHNLETLELTGLFRTRWINAKQKKYDKLQIYRGQHDDSEDADGSDTDSMDD